MSHSWLETGTAGIDLDRVKRAARAARRTAARPRVKITQVPTNDWTEQHKQLRPIIVRHPGRLMSWQEARAIGMAYARVMAAPRQPKWPTGEALQETRRKSSAAPKVERAKKPSWWEEKFADVVERRTVTTTPKYRARGARRKRPGGWKR